MQVWDIYHHSHVDSNASNKNVKSLSKLVRADISAIGLDIPLKAICNVEFLCIDKYLNDIPVFLNLTHLELVWWRGMNWHLALAMLKQCSMLQSFFLDMITSTADLIWISPCFVPECLSSQLRKCCITYYEGKESELQFVKYILENSRVLRTMAICTLSSLPLKVDKLKLLKELSLCPRSSPICELSFK
ncbi:putative FBD-associated F-box protein At5g56440 [Lotus japonicus]|uniref:putative FBD-associated F-box protein At5g56440 n=1 Tax=Lotus japonicus TaxID=34305 RepID=UPI00258DB06D|nr:putative FBD-associated F-box protein At5g56440 [Lotus japonicus]